ncbi:hypothetical protein [Streptomyces sp. NBC_00878]|uniref:hypothetical protein n=1 Tax=Streptomyces sp. NBC_00878 TaxID=2975854 RepID=UPI00225124C2|nr:hypothetical protein [Streptomyces sp. NBC_00878]MCX4905321.1 hypothetical protein [Streptomyces sp. NBC_00878]
MPGKTKLAVMAATAVAAVVTTVVPAQSAPSVDVGAAHSTTCSVGGWPKSGARADISWTSRTATVKLTVWDKDTWLRPTKAFIEGFAGRTYVGDRDLTADEGQQTASFTLSTSKPGGITLIKLWSKSGANNSVVRHCAR